MFPQAVCGYGSQDALPFRAIKEGELYFQEDREVNLVELALATNIPKGCAETAVRGQDPPRCPPCPGTLPCQTETPPEHSEPPPCSLAVHVSYLDGKGNLEPQGAGKEVGGSSWPPHGTRRGKKPPHTL